MAGLIASKDWSTTALGDTNNWSPSIKLIVGIMTGSGFPMAVRWGPEFILIYNDGYRSILADKHPWALGLPFRVVWPEVVSELIPLQEAILAGESPGVYSEDLPLTIRRRGMCWETAHFTVGYSPVPDPSSPTGIGGVLVTAVETSERLRVERALELKTQELSEANRQLQEGQALYQSALATNAIKYGARAELAGVINLQDDRFAPETAIPCSWTNFVPALRLTARNVSASGTITIAMTPNATNTSI